MARPAPSKHVSVDKPNNEGIFRKNMGNFINPTGSNLIDRTGSLGEWMDGRTAFHIWPYSRVLETAPLTTAKLASRDGTEGINFGSQDYLGLSSHPAIHMAVLDALQQYGPHTASSPTLQGNTLLSLDLEASLAEFLDTEHILLFPTGWAAGFGTLVGLVRPEDHIVIDHLAHACLMQGAMATKGNLSFVKHNDLGSVRRRLQSIRAKDAENSILVVTEGLFSMDSDSPDIFTLQGICREFDAVLMVDVAHDLGASGPSGTGQIGIQKMLGEVDLVMGSFSKSFASNGGFLASHRRSVKQFLSVFGPTHVFSNALSPLQAGVANAALKIVRSAEGDQLRRQALSNINRLRDGFAKRGVECLGHASNVVPVSVGDESVAKYLSGLLESKGLLANLVEFPAVPRGKARFRFQVMATHTPGQIDEAVDILCSSLERARERVL
jgi:glycine C-acetyltransferase